MTTTELKILAIENRIELLAARGLHNMPIIHKLERRKRIFQAQK